MITFRCKSCNQKISVPEVHAGKRGRCPKCTQIVSIPEQANQGTKAKQVDEKYCGVVLDFPSKEQLLERSGGEDRLVENIVQNGLDPEVAEHRKLPWIIDLLLYPLNVSGLVIFGIVIGIPLIINVISWCLGVLSQVIPAAYLLAILFLFVALFIKFIILLYVYWFFCQCIRNSAQGNRRAPETMGSTPGIGELFGQIFRVLVCFVVLWIPVLYYLMIPLKPYMPWILLTWPMSLYGLFIADFDDLMQIYSFFVRNEVHFFSLVGLSVFIFPMGLLAVVMFDSLRGLNPILIVGSIFSTFFQYCVIAMVFCVPVVIFMGFFFGIFKLLPLPLSVMIMKSVNLYLLMISGHLLGRFYYRNEERLYWEA